MVLFQTGFKPFQLFVVLFSLSEESRWFPVMRTMLLSWASQPLRVSKSCEQQLLQSPGCFIGAVKVLRKARVQSSNTWGSCGSRRQPRVLPTGTGAVTSEGSVCDYSVWHKSITNIPGNSSCLSFQTAPGALWVCQVGTVGPIGVRSWSQGCSHSAKDQGWFSIPCVHPTAVPWAVGTQDYAEWEEPSGCSWTPVDVWKLSVLLIVVMYATPPAGASK